MPLIRGYTEVDDEGKITISRNIQNQARLGIGRPVKITVVRVMGTSQKPHLIICSPNNAPFISPQEAVFMEGISVVDRQGKIFLPEKIRKEAKFEPGYHLEVKVHGSYRSYFGLWIIVHIRTPKRLTTLQDKLRHGRFIDPDIISRMPLDY